MIQRSKVEKPNLIHVRVVITWHVICRVRARYFPFGLSLIIVKGAPYSEKGSEIKVQFIILEAMYTYQK